MSAVRVKVGRGRGRSLGKSEDEFVVKASKWKQLKARAYRREWYTPSRKREERERRRGMPSQRSSQWEVREWKGAEV